MSAPSAAGSTAEGGLVVDALVKRFGGLLASDHVSLTLAPGEIHAIIGPNGAGKTTLINQLSGELLPDAGRIVLGGHDLSRLPPYQRALLGLGRSYQVTSVFMEMSVLHNVVMAVQAHSGHSFAFWRPVLSDPVLVEPARRALEMTGLADRADTTVAAMAHGERRQVEIAMALATGARMLLLDEPMAGMSHAESEGLVALLKRLKGHYGILLVEHDMDAVFALADRISVLVCGRVLVTGTPEQIRAHPEVREAYLGEETPS